ncbi:hypothetical protein ID866_3401 [Astraeus odoratus]|nr:hypothetical protein ID866_3401 [Astraeus odoratus]
MNGLHERVELPQQLISPIQHILEPNPGEAEDPLDSQYKFDLVHVLNQLLPDEAALSHLEAIQGKLAESERQLQREIDLLEDELRRDQDPDRMQLIQEMIFRYRTKDLLGQMSRIREKASESEAVVCNITKDIQVLDFAKKNLITSMTTLKRLQMLGVRPLQCRVLGLTGDVAANALTQLEDQVKDKRYAEVAQTLAAVKQISTTFKSYTNVPRIVQLWKRIQYVTGEIRTNLDAEFDAFYLQDPSKLSKVSHITDACAVVDVLGPDVRTQLIERYITLELKEYRRIFRASDEAGHLDNLSRRFAWFRRLLTSHESEMGKAFPSEWQVGWWLFAKFVAITRALADMLAPHRGPRIRGSLDTITRPPTATSTPRASVSADGDEEPAPIVMPSSTELFYVYAQSLDHCAKLSAGQALFDLYGIQKKWLKIYAGPPQNQVRKSVDTRFDASDLQQACLVINTADYCLKTASELEDKIKEKVSEKFKEKVTLQAERDLFVSVISGAINWQLRELETACDGGFLSLSRVNWSMMNQVTGHSSYVDDLTKAIEQVVELLQPLIEQKKYLRNFLDKACSLILTRFTNAVVKSRPLKEIGAEQLLIDLGVVKSCLLKLPGEALASSGYTRSLTKITARLEALLKVTVTPVDPPEGFILNYTLLIGDASFSNFQKVLDLKGTPKAEQNSLLDTFVTIASTKPELESTSFLSSLDMDPPASVMFGSPGPSRVVLPLIVTASSGADGTLGVLGTPPLSGPSTGSSVDGTALKGSEPGQKREVFSDIRRFVSFGLRRDTQSPS